MRINQEVLPYISGEKFSTGLKINFLLDNNDYIYQERVSVLREMCRDKKVLHIGCIDHNPEVVSDKIAKGKWLHIEITNSASFCRGVDINSEGIQYIKDNLGIDNIFNCNILTDELPEELKIEWDIVIIPEVIEHLNDPINFLREVKNRIRTKQIVVTVPNAFTLESINLAKQHIESINTDHRFWFTPYTLVKNLHEAGLKAEYIVMCHNGRINQYKWMKNWKLSRKPLLRSAIIAVCNIK